MTSSAKSIKIFVQLNQKPVSQILIKIKTERLGQMSTNFDYHFFDKKLELKFFFTCTSILTLVIESIILLFDSVPATSLWTNTNNWNPTENLSNSQSNYAECPRWAFPVFKFYFEPNFSTKPINFSNNLHSLLLLLETLPMTLKVIR